MEFLYKCTQKSFLVKLTKKLDQNFGEKSVERFGCVSLKIDLHADFKGRFLWVITVELCSVS